MFTLSFITKKEIKMDVEEPSNPIERIRAAYDLISKTQRRIANLLLEKSDKACFMSLNEISAEAKVTPVTVMKFVKRLGYASFSDFKKEYQSYFQGMIAPRSVVRNHVPDIRTMANGGARQIMENELRLLQASYDMLSEDRLLEAVNYIKNARKIYLVARGLSVPIAELLQTRLTFLSLESEILKLDNIILLPRTLVRAGQEDVFIVFTFPNYTPSIGDIAQCARLRGSKIITITDKTTSPPACYSDLILLCHIEITVFYNSMTAPLSIVNILAELLALEMKESLEAYKESYQALALYLDRNM